MNDFAEEHLTKPDSLKIYESGEGCWLTRGELVGGIWYVCPSCTIENHSPQELA